MTSALHIYGLSKSFGSTAVLRDISLALRQGELMTLLGASGSGKSTLLRIIGGLEQADAGAITYGGVPLADGAVGFVFQQPVLYPHLTLEENILFAQRFRATGTLDRDHYYSLVSSLGLGDHLGKKPAQLSGGQAQRAGIARALVRKTPVVLFDEPLSSVDENLSHSIRADLQNLHRELGFTGIYVTHHQDEALTMGQTLAVLSAGKVLQQGSPAQLLNSPATPEVARLLHPGYNLLTPHTSQDAGAGKIQQVGFSAHSLSTVHLPGALTLSLRLTQVRSHTAGTLLTGTLSTAVPLPRAGAHSYLPAASPIGAVLPLSQLAQTGDRAPAPGETLNLYLPAQGIHLYPAPGFKLNDRD